MRIAVDVLCSVRARPCRLSSAASHGLTRALRVAGFHANDMSYRPLHVNSFEVDSPDVKYGCASSLALLSPTLHESNGPSHAIAAPRRTPPARSDEYIESTYQYHSTHVIENNGKVVSGRPALAYARENPLSLRERDSSTGGLGGPPDCKCGGSSSRA